MIYNLNSSEIKNVCGGGWFSPDLREEAKILAYAMYQSTSNLAQGFNKGMSTLGSSINDATQYFGMIALLAFETYAIINIKKHMDQAQRPIRRGHGAVYTIFDF